MNRRVMAAMATGMLLGAAMSAMLASSANNLATAGPVRAEVGSVMAIATDSAAGTQLLYVIDSQQQVFSVYEFDTKRSKLKLAAARRYAADHQLQEYNTESPTVAEIDKLVQPR